MEKGKKIFIYQRKNGGACFIGRPHLWNPNLIMVYHNDFVNPKKLNPYWCILSNYKCMGALTIKTIIE